MTTLEAAPIACTLTRGDFKDRASWIRELASRSLRAARRTPLALHLTYAPEAAAQVRELVRKERSCCAFLIFELGEDPAGVHLTITAPEDARDAVDLLFAHFAPDAAILSSNPPTLDKEPA